MQDNFKCPICGAKPLLLIKDDNPNIKFVITQIDISTTPTTFIWNSGVELEMYNCTFCNFNFFRNPQK